MPPRPLVWILLVANMLVLLGQVWPEGRPPFAAAVDLGTAIANAIGLALLLLRRRPPA